MTGAASESIQGVATYIHTIATTPFFPVFLPAAFRWRGLLPSTRGDRGRTRYLPKAFAKATGTFGLPFRLRRRLQLV